MRKFFYLATLFVIGASVAGIYIYQKYRVAPGLRFAELALIADNNEERNFATALAPTVTPVIVVFAQSWCRDCDRELPRLRRLHQANFPQIPVVVLTDEDAVTLKMWRARLNLPFIYYRTKKSFEGLGVHAYPTTYILDASLHAVYSKVGNVEWQRAGVKEALNEKN